MDLARTAEHLLAHALSLPGAWEDHPWGERVAKVGPKVFLFFGRNSAGGESFLLSVKLPASSISALDRPECEPTGYGMGKHGWVTAKYQRGDTPPLELLKAWIEESYRAIAPKKLVQSIDGAAILKTAKAKKPVRMTKASPAKKKSPSPLAKSAPAQARKKPRRA
ncbi:MAG: MmcQ/YjbR family DNA-binding protein [Planctomycetota bacterium]|nr:MmcQ/YjbR family DNA-binding protein [Planctomycetota bacterium]